MNTFGVLSQVSQENTPKNKTGDASQKNKPYMHVIVTKRASENINKQLKRSVVHSQYNKADSVCLNDFIVHKMVRGSSGKDNISSKRSVDVRVWR